MNKKIKVLSIVSLICSSIIHLMYIFLLGYMTYVLTSISSSLGTFAMFFNPITMLIILGLLAAIVALSLSLSTLVKFCKPIEKFKKRVAITTVVFNYIFVLVSILMIFNYKNANVIFMVLAILFVILLVLCNVVLHIALSKISKDIAQANNPTQSKVEVAQPQQTQQVQQTQTSNDLQAKLTNLQNLLNSGSITQEEFNEMRTKLINEDKNI